MTDPEPPGVTVVPAHRTWAWLQAMARNYHDGDIAAAVAAALDDACERAMNLTGPVTTRGATPADLGPRPWARLEAELAERDGRR